MQVSDQVEDTLEHKYQSQAESMAREIVEQAQLRGRLKQPRVKMGIFDQPRIVKELKTLLDQSKASGRSRPERPTSNP